MPQYQTHQYEELSKTSALSLLASASYEEMKLFFVLRALHHMVMDPRSLLCARWHRDTNRLQGHLKHRGKQKLRNP